MATLSAVGCDSTWSRDLPVADPLLCERLAALKGQIAASQIELGLPPESVGLVAVSKTHPASAVLEARATGHHDFGENYVQEGVAKVLAWQPHTPLLIC
jgi:Predicted enzyme with a TIM-barrel fold